MEEPAASFSCKKMGGRGVVPKGQCVDIKGMPILSVIVGKNILH